MQRALTLIAVTFAVAAVPLLSATPAAADEPEHISGADRYETALAASQAAWQTSDEVVVATAEDFPDALAAASLATREGAPLLLVPSAHLPQTLADEIARLDAAEVTIVGGSAAVAPAVRTALADLPGVEEVVRLEGGDRYETAAAVARDGGASDEAVLVSGEDFPDAVTATALAIDPAAPILLTEPERLSSPAGQALSDLGVDHVTVVGGEKAVGDNVTTRIDAAIDHVVTYGSKHTESIVTENTETARAFMTGVDAASVFHNASTRVADGHRYGRGAEVGISTGKIHARGPVGLDGLTTYKYYLEGDGHLVATYAGEDPKPFTHREMDAEWVPGRRSTE